MYNLTEKTFRIDFELINQNWLEKLPIINRILSKKVHGQNQTLGKLEFKHF